MESTHLDYSVYAKRAHAIACATAICQIEVGAEPVLIDGRRWLDLRPMLDAREYRSHWLDKNLAHIEFALRFELIERHATDRNLVRINSPKAYIVAAGGQE